jgi:hypothetical protein
MQSQGHWRGVASGSQLLWNSCVGAVGARLCGLPESQMHGNWDLPTFLCRPSILKVFLIKLFKMHLKSTTYCLNLWFLTQIENPFFFKGRIIHLHLFLTNMFELLKKLHFMLTLSFIFFPLLYFIILWRLHFSLFQISLVNQKVHSQLWVSVLIFQLLQYYGSICISLIKKWNSILQLWPLWNWLNTVFIGFVSPVSTAFSTSFLLALCHVFWEVWMALFATAVTGR